MTLHKSSIQIVHFQLFTNLAANVRIIRIVIQDSHLNTLELIQGGISILESDTELCYF